MLSHIHITAVLQPVYTQGMCTHGSDKLRSFTQTEGSWCTVLLQQLTGSINNLMGNMMRGELGNTVQCLPFLPTLGLLFCENSCWLCF